jgi:hypothetical protein
MKANKCHSNSLTCVVQKQVLQPSEEDRSSESEPGDDCDDGESEDSISPQASVLSEGVNPDASEVLVLLKQKVLFLNWATCGHSAIRF